jgi:hypothetical protein
VIPYPLPPEDATTLGVAETVELSPGEKATIEFEPEQSNTVVYLPAVAISKAPVTSYTVTADDSVIWDARLPPTDIDDLSAPWIPVRRVNNDLTVEVAYLADSGAPRTYHVQPIGWEI